MSDNQAEQHKRRYPRYSLRVNEAGDILQACDGITVDLVHRPWWRPGKLGIANIKDISRGGVGLISSAQLRLGQELIIRFDDIELPVTITHGRQIQGPLMFYGASYLNVDRHVLRTTMAKARQLRNHYRLGRMR
ncbi:hypothetical protein NFHSH190041_01510 [Shewanella sp. NFH-SH190041]|uniref:PilZ domain-containing protein n=1 Tax=Shewanella sp. NFH-SH190041 TaxID=2950245 RepID=UPI0021C2B1C5|nr:PilZ domain-containing protein [Shewanella sp. NFH-SH190041]BDM62699.1 hypothetical protein NFHSH190041_01510 [Shewanella sp. NFH-SH190041]